jgi:hypothetical protein
MIHEGMNNEREGKDSRERGAQIWMTRLDDLIGKRGPQRGVH